MNHTKLAVALLAVGVLASAPAGAEITSDAIAATQDLYDQLNASNVANFARYVPEEGFSEYNTEGAKLARMTMDYFGAVMKSGVKIDLHAVELTAQSLGDTVIVTGYRAGTITPPGAEPIRSRQQMTFVWAKEKGRLKVRHVHLAPVPGN